jgi:membrane protein
MVSQAVAFNIFLAFFPMLLVALELASKSLREKSGEQLFVRFSPILPPGTWQLVSEYALRPEANTWRWVLLGWAGTLLVGSQVMKLIKEGIHMIYGDHERHSFLGRQLRGLLLFCVTIVAWLGAVALSVFGQPLQRWMVRGPDESLLVRSFWAVMPPILAMILALFVLALIYGVSREATTWSSVLPGAAAASILWWSFNLLFGIYLRKVQYQFIRGEVATAIGLMVWMEFSAMVVFLGAAWNAESPARTY